MTPVPLTPVAGELVARVMDRLVLAEQVSFTSNPVWPAVEFGPLKFEAITVGKVTTVGSTATVQAGTTKRTVEVVKVASGCMLACH